MKIEQVKLEDLKELETNAKKHSKKQLERLAESIKEFGWRQPIIITADNYIIAGHGRYKVGKMLGFTHIPAIRHKMTRAQAKAYNIADNLTASTKYDEHLLNMTIKELTEEDMNIGAIGLEETEIQDRLTGIEIEMDFEDYDELIEEKATGQGDHQAAPQNRLTITGPPEVLTPKLIAEIQERYQRKGLSFERKV